MDKLKLRLQGIIIGVIITTIILSGTFAAGLRENKTIDVVLNAVSFKVNGKQVESDSINYGGANYVPVRIIAEMCGKDVIWDAENNTVNINDKVATIDTTSEVKASSDTDKSLFRKVSWGFTKEQVKSVEEKKPEIIDNALVFTDVNIASLDSDIFYLFNNEDSLYKIACFSNETHTNKNEYINDYNKYRSALIQKYGEPTLDFKDIWLNDLYKDDPYEYGFAISIGHLKYACAWELEDTNILLTIDGDNYKIDLNFIMESKTVPFPESSSGM